MRRLSLSLVPIFKALPQHVAFLPTFGIVLATMVIRMRHTRSHTKNRRSHHALEAPNLAKCSNCGASHRQHHMCLECGFYKGRQVIDLATEKGKREARMRAKKEMISAQSASAPLSEAEAVATTEKKSKAKK
jgi:large subunit ribosomal protein L32